MSGVRPGREVFERLSRAQLRDLIIADDTAAQEEAGDEAAAAVPEPAAADGEGEGEEDQTHAEDLGPQLRDGTPVLAMLSFDLAWLEDLRKGPPSPQRFECGSAPGRTRARDAPKPRRERARERESVWPQASTQSGLEPRNAASKGA